MCIMNFDKLHIALLVLIVLIVLVFLYFRSTNKTEPCSCGANCQCNMINKDMIKLWVQHILYTRLVVMAVLSDDKGLDAIMGHLIQNQKDIGNLMSQTYGSKVGNDVTTELTKHITIAGQVLGAVKSGNKIEQTKAINDFYKNADDIGKYLDNLLHTNKFKHHMKMHIETLIDDVTAYATKNYSNDVRNLNKYVDSTLDMAFDLSK